MFKIVLCLTLLVTATCGHPSSRDLDSLKTRRPESDVLAYHETSQDGVQTYSNGSPVGLVNDSAEFKPKNRSRRCLRCLGQKLNRIFNKIVGIDEDIVTREEHDRAVQQQQTRLAEQERVATQRHLDHERTIAVHNRQMTQAVAELQQVLAQWQQVTSQQQITQRKYDDLQRQIIQMEIQVLTVRVSQNENDSIKQQIEQITQAKLQQQINQNANQALKDQLVQLQNQQYRLEQRIKEL